MSFSAEWLALRADADRLARNVELAADLAEALFGTDPLQVLDLGSGTGANLSALSPLFGTDQRWVLVDNDPSLLDLVTAAPGVSLDRHVADLAGDLDALFQPQPHLVTASAFFDLAGAALIDRLVGRCVQARAVFYTVLTYDGQETWHPQHPLDGEVLSAFGQDQLSDKGLGPALGPDATAYLARAFRVAGYEVRTGPSDWQLAQPEDAALISALANGSADAVADRIGADKADIWRSARTDAQQVIIGHQDLLALPPSLA